MNECIAKQHVGAVATSSNDRAIEPRQNCNTRRNRDWCLQYTNRTTRVGATGRNEFV